MLSPFYLLAQDKVAFVAKSDAKQVVLGGYFEVSFVLSGANGTNFTPPKFHVFNVLDGPSRSIRTTGINGVWSRELSHSYTLQPKQIGKFAIPPATIKVNGKELKTEIIYIEVKKGKNTNANTQEDLIKQIGKEVMIKAVPSTTEARIGEQVLMDYKIYTTREIQGQNIVSESEYPGFFTQDIRYDNPVIKEVIDGVQYSTKVLRRVALFPQQAGILLIDSMVMEVGVSIEDKSKRRRGFFYTPLVTRFQIKTKPTKINVRSLPPGAPPSFSGAVGKYVLSSGINRTTLTTDDALSVKIHIKGNGDMRQVQAPKLMVSDSFDLYDPKTMDEKNFESVGIIKGSKSIEYLMVPKYPGNYSIRPEFTYYDTDSLKYITLKSSPYKVKITKGKNFGKSVDLTTLENANLGEIRVIHSVGELHGRGSSFVGSGVFWTLFALPFLLLGGVLVNKQVKDSKGPIDLELLRRNQARKIATEKLSQAKTFLDQQNARSFYDEISKGMYGYIGDKLGIPLSQMGKENISQQLTSLGVSETTRERFMGILKTCEMALFAGKDNTPAMKETYDTALEVVVQVEEELKA